MSKLPLPTRNASHKNAEPAKFRFRREPSNDDLNNISRLTSATGFFSLDEVIVAVELVIERLRLGNTSGYEFLFAEHRRRLVAYTCYGPISCTRGSYDLYWIVVDPDYQGRGIGKDLLARTEDLVRDVQGSRLYIETSSRQQYAPTRAFYDRCGYRLEAVLEDFYAPGDGKCIYCKTL